MQVSFFRGEQKTKTGDTQTNIVVGHYQQKVQNELSRYGQSALKRVPEQIQQEPVRYSFKTSVQLNKDFSIASIKCAKIVIDLIQNLNILKNHRKNQSWFDKLVHDETLVKRRLGVLKKIVIDLSAHQLTQWNMPKYVSITQILQDGLASNKGLTASYNNGFITGEKPFFIAGDGNQHKLIEDASNELSEHKELFKKYFDKMAEEQPLTTLVNEADEAFGEVLRWGNSLFGNN